MIPRYSICAITAREPKHTIDNMLQTLEQHIVALELHAAQSVSAAQLASSTHTQRAPGASLGLTLRLNEARFGLIKG